MTVLPQIYAGRKAVVKTEGTQMTLIKTDLHIYIL